ncbi:type II toxin-antitoxin system RelE/ParE family toxin [Rhizobium sp. AN80A]|uniref:type II toxin-antitoxin system RelE/ParE family toxin n=1 Tax=Rhizobium sp. AN80A TaxID=3040673 RepID=UPI0024B335B5|nr:type II toxin-antitoxin system RelE/ParE family toxin [Rhizobium sp. AN80A]
MLTVVQTATFAKWLSRQRDRRAVARIASRLLRIETGHLGDIKAVGDGVSELRIDYGPGYRIYVTMDRSTLIVLLSGGDKSTQTRDIIEAKRLAREWKDAR